MYLKPFELFNQLKDNELKSFYLFAGEEEYLKEQTLSYIKRKVKADSLNFEIFYATEASVPDIISSLYTVPFFAQKKLIVIKQAQKIKAHDQERLSQVIEELPLSVCLVLLWQDKVSRQAKKSVLFSKAEELQAVVDFRNLYESELPGWIQKEVSKLDKKISFSTAQYLVQETGNLLYDIKNEIDKLNLYTAARKEITTSDIQSVSGSSKQFNLYELGETVEAKDSKKALLIVEKLLKEGEAPLRILSTIYRTIRRLLAAKSLLLEKKCSFKQIEKELTLNPYFDRNFSKNLDRFSLGELKKALALILGSDLELKSTNKPESLILDDLVFSLTRN